MKKLLFIFVATMPALVMGMENGEIKLYSVERLKQGYEQLFPLSNGRFYEGWRQGDVGRGFIYNSGLAGIFDSGCYQPKITDIAVANLLVYCRKHEEQMGQLQQRFVEINNAINQQRTIENQIDQLKRDQDTEDHQFTENTVLGRRRIRIEALKREIETAYNLRTADITTLRENNRERDKILWRHESQIDQLEQSIRDCNVNAERYRANIITLQRNRNNHSGKIDHHARQIEQLQQDFRDHVRATEDKYDNDINQFVRKKIQEVSSTNEKDTLRNTHIEQLLEDVATLKKTLHQWIPNTATITMNSSVASGGNVYHNSDTKEEESTTSSCSTTDKIALKK